MKNAQTDDGFLWFGFKNITSLGPPARAMVHAEDIDIIRRVTSIIKATKKEDLEAWDEARPGFCETLDVERAISLARKNNTPLYIVHVSNGASVDVISRAKAEGVDVVGETCPQYLTLTKSSSIGALGKIAPPLRDDASKERLWQGIREGTIECVGSDHCSTTRDLKKSMWEGPPGAPGMGTLLPIMLSEGVNKGKITLEKLVEVCCLNNAKISGIYPQKGTLQVGSDADLVILDLDKKIKLSPGKMNYEVADFSPYEDWEIKGWPVLTMLRGRVIVEDGEFVATPGVGRYIPRKLS
jgi:dihydropyrimidinase